MTYNSPSVYFGNIRSAGWIKAPDSGLGADTAGSIDEISYAGGGTFVDVSGATHREYRFDWNVIDVDDLQFLFNYRNGLLGTGLLYFVDPYASYYNALPSHWAAPWLSADKWPSLIAGQAAPEKITATSTANNQPIYSAKYTIATPANLVPDRALVLLIPPTQQLSIGFSGSATGGGVVRIQPINLNGTLAATQDFTLLSASATTRMNKTFSGATYRAIKVYLTQTTTGISTITLDSGDAIYSIIGSSPTLTGNHKEGRGSTGMQFGSDISQSYTFFDETGVAPRRLVSASVGFKEVGAWL